MKKIKLLKLYIKFVLQGMYVAWVTEPILREKGRSMYSKKEKIEIYNKSITELNELRFRIKNFIS